MRIMQFMQRAQGMEQYVAEAAPLPETVHLQYAPMHPPLTERIPSRSLLCTLAPARAVDISHGVDIIHSIHSILLIPTECCTRVSLCTVHHTHICTEYKSVAKRGQGCIAGPYTGEDVCKSIAVGSCRQAKYSNYSNVDLSSAAYRERGKSSAAQRRQAIVGVYLQSGMLQYRTRLSVHHWGSRLERDCGV